jgi:hypothetical protein
VSSLRKAAEQALDVGWITLRLLRAESKYPVLVLIAELDEVCDALRAALAEPDEVAAAVKAEREACAKVCDNARPSTRAFDSRYFDGCEDCAAAIRARGGDVSDD